MKRIMATGVLVAALAACTVTPNPVVPDPENITGPIEQAAGIGGQVRLDQGMRAAMAYYAEQGSFSGFSPQAAAAYDPTISYNASPVAVEDQVSIRVVSANEVILVTKDRSGAVACQTFNGVTQATTSGAADATSIADC